MNKLEKVEYIIIHHTERNNDFPLFVKLRHIYLRGWENIGYHYLIGNTRPFTRNGQIYHGRPEEFEGAHILGYNQNSIGICLIGNFDKKHPSKEQFESLFSLVHRKMEQFRVPVENVRGHREFPEVRKSCPGKLIDMDYIRTSLTQREIPKIPSLVN